MLILSRIHACALALLAALALAFTALAAEAPARSSRQHVGDKTSGKARAKRKRHRSTSRTTRGPKGPKGDRGDRGEKGDKGDKGDPASSVVARARLASPTSTGDGGDVEVPLTGASWTAAPDEGDDFAGTVTLTLPDKCDPSSDPTDPFSALPPELGGGSFPGYAEVAVLLDGRDYVGGGFLDFSEDKAGQSVTVPLRFQGRALNGDAATPRSLHVRGYDGCGSQGQSFTITDVRINVYALH